jgi:hypothetical protein
MTLQTNQELANKVFNIPDELLWGRQERYEYNLNHGTRIKRKLKQEGVAFLQRNPITCCPLEIARGQYTLLVIIDGHHRTRFAPTANIFTIPAMIKTLEEIAELEKKPVAKIESELHDQIGLALMSFKEIKTFGRKPGFAQA